MLTICHFIAFRRTIFVPFRRAVRGPCNEHREADGLRTAKQGSLVLKLANLLQTVPATTVSAGDLRILFVEATSLACALEAAKVEEMHARIDLVYERIVERIEAVRIIRRQRGDREMLGGQGRRRGGK